MTKVYKEYTLDSGEKLYLVRDSSGKLKAHLYTGAIAYGPPSEMPRKKKAKRSYGPVQKLLFWKRDNVN